MTPRTRRRATIKPEDRVHYHPIIGEPHDGRVYVVSTIGRLGGHTDVAWLVGKSGCVAIDALSPVTEERSDGS